MRLGLVMSAGGAAFEQVARIASPEASFFVVTDRPCYAEMRTSDLGLPFVRIEQSSRQAFSVEARRYLMACHVEQVLLFFSRLVSEELFSVIPTYNVHPSLLPAFPGLNSVRRAHMARADRVGCTLHQVDGSIDGGPTVSQISHNVDANWDLALWEKSAYLMRVYCGLVWTALALELPLSEAPRNATHGLPERWCPGFEALQLSENVRIV